MKTIYTVYRNFISGIRDYLFDENVKKKLESVNFISILCDGLTEKSVTEQEVLFVVFTDPEMHLPTMTFSKSLTLRRAKMHQV